MGLIVLVLACVCVALPLLLAQRYGMVRLVSPLHFVAYFAFFGIFVKAVYSEVLGGPLFLDRYGVTDAAVLSGTVFATLFVAMICLGYVLAISGRRPRTALAQDAVVAALRLTRPWLLAAAAVGVFLLVTSLFLAARGFGGLAAAFSLDTFDALNTARIARIEGVEGYGRSFAGLKALYIVPTLALVVFLTRHAVTGRASDRLLVGLSLALCIVAALLQGGRFALVDLAVAYVFVFAVLGRRLGWGLMLKGSAGLAGLLALFVAMTTMRATKGAPSGSDLDVLAALDQLVSSTYFLDLNMPVLILSLSDPADRLLGSSYVSWLYGWVPRSIWLDKPPVTLGPYVKQVVLGQRGTLGGINPTGPGEAILNFGWLGVFVGAALGVAYRRIEEFLLAQRRLVNGGLWFYPLLFYPFIQSTLQSSFSAAVVTLAAQFVVVWLLLRLLHGPPVRAHRRAGPPAMVARTVPR